MKKPNQQHASGGPIDPKKLHVGKEGPEIFVPTLKGDTRVRVVTPDNTAQELQRKIDGAIIDLREIMAHGRNPASGWARKALAKLES